MVPVTAAPTEVALSAAAPDEAIAYVVRQFGSTGTPVLIRLIPEEKS